MIQETFKLWLDIHEIIEGPIEILDAITGIYSLPKRRTAKLSFCILKNRPTTGRLLSLFDIVYSICN